MPMTPIQQMMEVELVQDERMKMLMASWLRNETSRAEDEELFQCGYLKVIDLKGTFAITAKGWELAHPRKPRHVSESTPPTYNFRGQSRSLVVQAPQIDSFIFDEGRSLGRISRVYGYSILHDVWLVADQNDELWEVSPYHGTRPMIGDDSEPSGNCELNATTDDKEVINEWFGYKPLMTVGEEAAPAYGANVPVWTDKTLSPEEWDSGKWGKVDPWVCSCGNREHFIGIDDHGYGGPDECDCESHECECETALTQTFRVVRDEADGETDGIDYDSYDGGGYDSEISSYDRIYCGVCNRALWLGERADMDAHRDEPIAPSQKAEEAK